MAQASRTALFAKLHKVLKKHYKPFAADPQRSVLEYFLFACLLEDASYDAAQTAMAALTHTFFDWNEVRVTSVAELSEVMSGLHDPRGAAVRVKRVLHGIFEATYSFDLEDKRKKNLGVTQKWFEKLDGATPFCVAYVTQAALGGHAIPLDGGTMHVMHILDLASEKDVAAASVPGLERAIPKSKGVDFGSLLHQLGADFTANPFSPRVRDILLEINPAAAERFPKRRAPRPAPEAVAAGKKAAEPADGKTAKKKAPPPAKPAAAEKAAATEKPAAAEKAAAKKRPEKPAAKPAAKAGAAKSDGAKKKTAATLSKKKPR